MGRSYAKGNYSLFSTAALWNGCSRDAPTWAKSLSLWRVPSPSERWPGPATLPAFSRTHGSLWIPGCSLHCHRHLPAGGVLNTSLHFGLSMAVHMVPVTYPQETLPWPGVSVFSRKLWSQQCWKFTKLKLEEGKKAWKLLVLSLSSQATAQ